MIRFKGGVKGAPVLNLIKHDVTNDVLGDAVSGQQHAPTAAYLRGNSPRCTLERRMGGPHS
jgi:hypothetical protein